MADRPLQAEKDIVRIPLYSTDYNRQVPAGTRGFNNTWGSLTYPVLPQHDAVLVNCWAERAAAIPGVSAAGDWTIVKRPGISRSDANMSVLGGTLTNYRVHALIAMEAITGCFLALVTPSAVSATHLVSWFDTGSGGVTDLGSFTGSYFEIGKYHLSEINIGGVPGVGINYQTASGSGSWSGYAMSTYSGGSNSYSFLAGAVTKIVDVDFPNNFASVDTPVGPFVQLNQHVFIMGRSGKVYNSDQDSISSWNARGVQPASIEPDAGIGLVKYKQHIMAFGTQSVEFFEDAGLAPPGGPLQRTEQAFIKFGCLGSKAFTNIADTVYWIAGGASNVRGLYKLDQYSPVKVSGPNQMQFFANADTNTRLDNILLGGNMHLLVNCLGSNSGPTTVTPFLVANATFTPDTSNGTESFPPTINDIISGLLCYNIDQQSWWWWTDETCEVLNIFAANSYPQDSGTAGRTVIIKRDNIFNTGGHTDGYIFSAQDPHITSSAFSGDTSITYTDNDGLGNQKSICVIAQLAPLEFNIENRKVVNKAKLITDAMIKYTEDVSTGNQLYWLYNRNDGQGTIFSRATPIPAVNDRYYLNNLGMARKIYMALVCKTSMPLRIKALELNVTQSTH